MAAFHYLVMYLASAVVLATTCATTTSIKRPIEPSSHAQYKIELATSYNTRHARSYTTSPGGWNATRIPQPTGTAVASRPTTTVTVGDQGKLVFSPSSLNASVGSTVAFDFLGLNHTLTQSDLLNPCHSSQGFDTGFRQYNPSNVSGKFIVEIEITSQDPKWFFCAQIVKRSHCLAGMVFSLNARGAHNEFLHNAIAGIGATSAPTNSACSLKVTTPNVSTYMAPTGTLSTRPSISSVVISPPIFGSAGSRYGRPEMLLLDPAKMQIALDHSPATIP
ncbi:serine-threonine rich protein [Stemphylium lycopersici]|nr:serine-threonine rich protein [Stemphylium lycopersici]